MKSLTRLRTDNKLTQSDMADMLSISVSNYNMYENGQRKIPRKTAKKIAEIFNVSIEDIFLPVTFTVSKNEKSA